MSDFPTPKDQRSDSMTSIRSSSSSMITLEESDLEPSHPSNVIPRSYSPSNSRDSRKRYSAYYDNNFSLSLPNNNTPLLESLLDPTTGADSPLGRSRPSAAAANAAKRSSWYLDQSSSSNTFFMPPQTIVADLPAPNAPFMNGGNVAPFKFGGDNSKNTTSNNNTTSNTTSNTTNGLGPSTPVNATFNPVPIHLNAAHTSSLHSAHSSVSSNASIQSIPPPPIASRPSSPFEGRPKSPAPQPFNFQSTTLMAGNATPRPSHRRGHKYKHSSVSMNFFKEDVRAPLAIPASLPIPNISECQQSMSWDQKVRIFWGAFHLFVTCLVYKTNSPFTALSALAHLLLYDAMGALMCAVVDILGNFDVWKKSSIHLPFGLERVEVLAGFALSILLIFMGGDIMSHSIQEIVQVFYGDASHSHGHAHAHAHGSGEDGDHLHWSGILFKVCLAILVTVVSAVGLDNHTRISKALRSISSMPSILSNPSHFITIFFCAVVLTLPFFSAATRTTIDAILTPCIAISMCYLGWTLAKSLGGMLVMSFPGENRIDEVEAELMKLPGVVAVSDISVWQVHHSAWLACMKVEIRDDPDTEQRVREESSRIVKLVMGEGEDGNDIRWETTIDITRV